MKPPHFAALALVVIAWPGACTEHEPEIRGSGTAVDAACAPGSCDDTPAGAVSWCEALRVIESKCQRCHRAPPENDAPFALMTFEDTQRCHNGRVVFERMHAAVGSGAMPFVELTTILGLDPPVEDITPEEKATLITWLEQGACPVGGFDCTRDGGPEASADDDAGDAAHDVSDADSSGSDADSSDGAADSAAD